MANLSERNGGGGGEGKGGKEGIGMEKHTDRAIIHFTPVGNSVP